MRESGQTLTSPTDSTAARDNGAGFDPVVSIVTTTMNEAENVQQLYEEIVEVMDADEMQEYQPYEVITVDDSTDETRDIIESWCDERENWRAIYPRRPFGQSPALKAGIDHAAGEIVVTMDADLQNDPHDIPRLLERLEDGYDCVSGWRRDRHDPWHKTIPSAIQTPLAKLTGPDINDFGCTLKAYRGEAIRDVDLYGEGHRYLPSRLHKLGYSVGEEVVNHRPREHGESRYGAGRLVRGFVDLMFHIFWFRYSSRPGHLLGMVGFVMLGIGMAVGGHAAAMRLLFGSPVIEHLPRLLASVGMVIIGLQLFLFALLAELVTKLYYQDETEYRIAELVGFD